MPLIRCVPMRFLPFCALAAIVSCNASAAPANTATWEYQVKKGDSLWSFADMHLSSAAYVPRLQALNHIGDPYRLTPGSVIKVPYPWVKQQPSAARIEEMSGEVSAKDAAGKPLPVGKEQRYGKGVQFQTGADSMLKLRFEDGSTLTLSASSSAQLQTQIYYPTTGSANTEILLDKGGAGSSVIPNILMPNRYRIKTPSAVTTVRGTEFRVTADNIESSATEVLRGKVNVSNEKKRKQSVDVPAGFGTIADKNGGPGKPEALPPPPDLQSLPRVSQFNPPLLQWQTSANAAAWHLRLNGPGADGKLISDRTVRQPAFFPRLPGNGEYTLQARARSQSGLEGADAEHRFVLQAYPQPPLLLAAADAEVRGQTLKVRLSGPESQTVLIQVSRSADFSSMLPPVTAHAAESDIELPEKGKWFWRVARLNADGKPGPFSDTQSVMTKTLFSSIADSKPTLLGRRYPLPGARYTLQLASDPAMKDVRYSQTLDQPSWDLSTLPHGQLYARIQVENSDGYHATESIESVNIE